ncbi:MAG: shikimate kinase [Rikenellaceae bacterium]
MLIFLVGYMACGKSTIGRKLNQRLKYQLYDTDKLIVESEGMSVSELFDLKGEEYFRECERDTLKHLIDSNINAVISTGGGTPIWNNNMQLMNQAGLTIYIARTAENIAKRISPFGREKRPKLRGLNDNELVEVMKSGIAQRDSKYRESKFIIEADCCSDDMILDMIVERVSQSLE